ncbi:acyl-CoA thioesterase II [Brevibacterium daeguense]|uniref:Acyl-CoA thioesterase II n=1 Tax=Brevibacterium daeguense TaxID=909936 RepID=A0ABP8EG08_9MICO|nr:acyl-CoA thioesterase domain-containing protein [Brevibacterium daeguense]
MGDVLFSNAEPLEGSFLEMMELEEIDTNIYRAGYVFEEPYALYGGQVAAQSLLAAALTVDEDRAPHSLHGYFLRPGNASRPTVFQVFRDRDGRSYSARRVVALQGGQVIFNMSASFTIGEESPDLHEPTAAQQSAVRLGAPTIIPRMFAFEGRSTDQVRPAPDYPMRFWARCTEELGDSQLMHTCALTYLSDIGSGLGSYNTDEYKSMSSLDHAIWFHRPVDMNDWVLTDFAPRSAARGRGLYGGDMTALDGTLVASVAQESLYRRVRK